MCPDKSVTVHELINPSDHSLTFQATFFVDMSVEVLNCIFSSAYEVTPKLFVMAKMKNTNV